MKKLIFITLLLLSISTHSHAQQDGFIGEVKLFAGNFAPRGWAFCEGQLIPISQNTALFSILGTTYGGDGRTTFALPDLRGRVPVGVGNGPGLTPTVQGNKFGVETTKKSQPVNSIPIHEVNPGNETLIKGSSTLLAVGNSRTGVMTIGDQNRNLDTNVRPSLGMHYIICLQGMFPSRN